MEGAEGGRRNPASLLTDGMAQDMGQDTNMVGWDRENVGVVP